MVILFLVVCCFCKQKTAYEMRISDWSSDVCSSDLCACWKKKGSSRVIMSTSSMAVRQWLCKLTRFAPYPMRKMSSLRERIGKKGKRSLSPAVASGNSAAPMASPEKGTMAKSCLLRKALPCSNSIDRKSDEKGKSVSDRVN